jgi:hypothetical protein
MWVFGTCNTEVFSDSNKRIAQILSYVGSSIVIFFCCLTILMNLCFRVMGFERFLDFLQEVSSILLYFNPSQVGLIVLFVFMGFFVLRPNWSGMCLATQIVLHAAMSFVLMIAISQSIFSMTYKNIYNFLYIFKFSINRGLVNRTSGCMAFFYYVLPIILTAGFTCAVYFPLKSEYENNGVQ